MSEEDEVGSANDSLTTWLHAVTTVELCSPATTLHRPFSELEKVFE